MIRLLAGDEPVATRSASINPDTSSESVVEIKPSLAEESSDALPTTKSELERALSMPVLSQPPRIGPTNFEKIRMLGAGSTGRVYLVRSVGLETEGFFAMKVVKKSELIKMNRVQRILTEKHILSIAHHPFIVGLDFTFQTPDFFYLIMQYCAGGEFFSFLKRQDKQLLSESQARFYAAEVLLALEYLHLLGVVYRDLKPENILVHESGHIMLSDFDLAREIKPQLPVEVAIPPNVRSQSFGQRRSIAVTFSSAKLGGSDDVIGQPVRRRSCCARLCGPPPFYPVLDTESHLDKGEKMASFVGTHEYVAPEIFSEEGYAGSVDWWAYGILLFEMVFGRTPFKGASKKETLENIIDVTEEVTFPDDIAVSNECKDLISKLLAKDRAQRLQNPLSIKAHSFFRTVAWPLIRHQKPPIIPTFVHSLKEKEIRCDRTAECDNEVPYAKGVNSPRAGRRNKQKQAATPASVQNSGTRSTLNSTPEEDAEPAETFESRIPEAVTSISTIESVSATNVDRSRSSSSNRFTKVGIDQGISGSGKLQTSKSLPEICSLNAASGATADDLILSFDYTGRSSSRYWSSTESSRTLRESLSELESQDSPQKQ